MDHCTDEELCVQGHIASKRQRPDLKLGVSDDRGEHPSIRCTQDAFAEPSLHPPPRPAPILPSWVPPHAMDRLLV